ncbi:MAG: carbon-nitrogen hydrolase family protein [Halobacteriota archaeon]|uniref:carbon-nitrogen hydrolase family protein n=1 Tax=Natronomonas sp. TaxID=2184060 RepID=UPI003975141E
MKTRVIQADPEHGNPAANASRLEREAERARSDGVELLVFPELYLTGYYLDTDEAASIVSRAEAVLPTVERASEDLTLVVGTALGDGSDPGLENVAVVYDRGERIGVYRKTHLYDDEKAVFNLRDAYPTFETSVGTIGVQICYDMEFPEVARQLTLSGAEIIVTISANMHPFETYQRAYRRARALENGRPHVLCNRVGAEGDLDFLGRSAIVDARGTLLASTESEAEIELTANLPDERQVHDTLTYLEDRRIELRPK